MRINKEIKAEAVRVIDVEGQQLGVMSPYEARKLAEEAGLDLVEISANANPPVCRIIDYGKYRYRQAKREKETKKAQHQIKVKEIKLKPNIDQHDLQTKIKRAREFLEKGNKVRVTCMFRGREMLHMDLGEKVLQNMFTDLEDVAVVEAPIKVMGRFMSIGFAPQKKIISSNS